MGKRKRQPERRMRASPSSRDFDCVRLVVLAAVEPLALAARSEVSVYQSASNTSKGQSVRGAKTPKIRAELFSFGAPKAAAPARSARARGLLRRRSRMRFQETIEQHFRRALVSKRFQPRARGSSHEMGLGAIALSPITHTPTEIGARARARTRPFRRRRRDRPRALSSSARGRRKIRVAVGSGWTVPSFGERLERAGVKQKKARGTGPAGFDLPTPRR